MQTTSSPSNPDSPDWLSVACSVEVAHTPEANAQKLVNALAGWPEVASAWLWRELDDPTTTRWRLVALAGAPSPASRRPVVAERPVLVGGLSDEPDAAAFVATLDPTPSAPTDPPPLVVVLGDSRVLVLRLVEALPSPRISALRCLAPVMGDAFDASEQRVKNRRIDPIALARDFVQTAPVPLLLEDAYGRVLAVNTPFRILLPEIFDRTDVVGMSLTSFEEVLGASLDHIDTRDELAAGSVFYCLTLSDGRTFECERVLMQGGHGKYLWYVRDVSERVRQQEALAHASRFYEYVLSALPADLVVFTPEGRYHFVTPSAIASPERRAAVIGHTESEYGAMRGLPEAVTEQRVACFEAAVATGEPQRFEESFPDRTGRMRYFAPCSRRSSTTTARSSTSSATASISPSSARLHWPSNTNRPSRKVSSMQRSTAS